MVVREEKRAFVSDVRAAKARELGEESGLQLQAALKKADVAKASTKTTPLGLLKGTTRLTPAENASGTWQCAEQGQKRGRESRRSCNALKVRMCGGTRSTDSKESNKSHLP